MVCEWFGLFWGGLGVFQRTPKIASKLKLIDSNKDARSFSGNIVHIYATLRIIMHLYATLRTITVFRQTQLLPAIRHI